MRYYTYKIIYNNYGIKFNWGFEMVIWQPISKPILAILGEL